MSRPHLYTCKRLQLSSLLASIVLALAGCGSGHPTTIPVQGTITYRGKALDKGEVVFFPTRSQSELPRRIASGRIDPQGQYSLSTFVKDDGAMPGEYAVAICRPKIKKGIEVEDENIDKLEPFVPESYSREDKTPLRATISADASGTQQLDFELKDQ